VLKFLAVFTDGIKVISDKACLSNYISLIYKPTILQQFAGYIWYAFAINNSAKKHSTPCNTL
jgi:hypothetical protein